MDSEPREQSLLGVVVRNRIFPAAATTVAFQNRTDPEERIPRSTDRRCIIHGTRRPTTGVQDDDREHDVVSGRHVVDTPSWRPQRQEPRGAPHQRQTDGGAGRRGRRDPGKPGHRLCQADEDGVGDPEPPRWHGQMGH